MKKILTRFISLIMGLTLFSCAKRTTLNVNNADADQSTLYGICYEINIRYDLENFDLDKDIRLLQNLGVKSLRLWMHMTDLLVNPNTINKEVCDQRREAIKKIQEAGITIIGMSHTNFNSGTAISGKPARDITTGSYYIAWLENYRLGFKTLAETFPEIQYWEMDNEVNNTDFMKNIVGESVYDQNEMGDIATDIFYYASAGIHEGNFKAKTVMGGLVGFLSGKIKTFMEKIYININSGDFGYFYGRQDKAEASKKPDNYFQIACWHPYITGAFSSAVFKKYNDDIYNVILENEKKHKTVFFSEIGFSNTTYKESVSAKYVTQMFSTIKAEMPYVGSVMYYKMFDFADAQKYWTKTVSRYGLFYDPDESLQYTNNETDTYVTAGNAKPAAYAFQKAAGGEGQLNLKEI